MKVDLQLWQPFLQLSGIEWASTLAKYSHPRPTTDMFCRATWNLQCEKAWILMHHLEDIDALFTPSEGSTAVYRLALVDLKGNITGLSLTGHSKILGLKIATDVWYGRSRGQMISGLIVLTDDM